VQQAWRRQPDDAWQAMLTSFRGAPTLRARHAARTLVQALSPYLADARPRAWQQVIRPFVEAVSLASMLYERARLEDDAAEWARAMEPAP
jgi:hypothetical protein